MWLPCWRPAPPAHQPAGCCWRGSSQALASWIPAVTAQNNCSASMCRSEHWRSLVVPACGCQHAQQLPHLQYERQLPALILKRCCHAAQAVGSIGHQAHEAATQGAGLISGGGGGGICRRRAAEWCWCASSLHRLTAARSLLQLFHRQWPQLWCVYALLTCGRLQGPQQRQLHRGQLVHLAASGTTQAEVC